MSAPTHYTCPACDGESPCDYCAGEGIILARDLPDTPHNHAFRPHTPSRRNKLRVLDRTAADPLQRIAANRASDRQLYLFWRYRARTVMSHTYAGLAQADMLARATMCESTAGRAVQAWRGAA